MQDCVLLFCFEGGLFLNNRLYGYDRLICYVWIHLLLAATKTKDVSFTCIVRLVSEPCKRNQKLWIRLSF